MVPDTGNERESAAGGQRPLTWTKWATVAQVVVIVVGFIFVVYEFLPYRVVGYTAANPETGVSYWPSSITLWSQRLALAPAAAGMLVAVVTLVLRGRALWLRYLQIGLWLLALASFVYIVDVCAPFTGLEALYSVIGVGGIAGVVIIVLLTLTLRLRRPASRQPRWHWAFALLAAAMPCIAATSGPAYAYGPGYGTATGIITQCSAAEAKANSMVPGPSLVPSPFVTVSAQNQAGKIVASQHLPLRTGTRYRMRLLTGTYSINISTEASDGFDEYFDEWVFVPADEADEFDFNDSDAGCVW